MLFSTPAALPEATAALLGCVAMPWLYPELRADLLAAAERLATEGRVARLRLRDSPAFWAPLAEDLAGRP